MGASLVYLDRPNTKKDTSSGTVQPTQNMLGYRYSCSAMQGWRLNMVSGELQIKKIGIMNHLIAHFCCHYYITQTHSV